MAKMVRKRIYEEIQMQSNRWTKLILDAVLV